MKGRVCIPIHNVDGELMAYAGRWDGSEAELPEGEEKYKFPKGFHKSLELFNLHRVKHCRHLIVVEGFFGAMRLHALRFPAVALMGSSLSDEQVALLHAHCPALRFMTVLLDGDEPGRKAGDTVAARLAQSWWTRIVHLADGFQPDTVDPALTQSSSKRRSRSLSLKRRKSQERRWLSIRMPVGDFPDRGGRCGTRCTHIFQLCTSCSCRQCSCNLR